MALNRPTKFKNLLIGHVFITVGTPAPSPGTTQQPDVRTKLLEKLELLMSNISSQRGSRQHPHFLKQSGNSSKY
ncbi:hypothetical protein ACTXT7_016737 [Hymenolepis weldensis]